jgi:hypothetical protein
MLKVTSLGEFSVTLVVDQNLLIQPLRRFSWCTAARERDDFHLKKFPIWHDTLHIGL